MKSFAQLKRDAKSKTMQAEMTYRYGTDIPARLAGRRDLVGARTNAIIFRGSDGQDSELMVQAASLIAYDEDTLTVYAAGFRELNEGERAVLQGWKQVTDSEDYQHRVEIDCLTDGSSTYYQEKAYFMKAGYLYLMGCEKQHGYRYHPETGKVEDDKIKGSVILIYKLYRKGERENDSQRES